MLLSNFCSLADSGCDISAFGGAYADLALAVTYHDKRAESEATTTLNDACNAVYVYDSLVELLFFLRLLATVVTARWTITALTLTTVLRATIAVLSLGGLLGCCLCDLCFFGHIRTPILSPEPRRRGL
jgi:hypothetical protein